MQSRNHKRAQAIVPYLVSTAIFAASIGALSLVIYPGRGTYLKENSLNNLRALAGAVRAYAIDNNDTLPGWVNNKAKPYGPFVHNTWDQQISPYVARERAYTDGGIGIRSYSQPKYHSRVVTYGLNGLLVTPPKANFDGNADFAGTNGANLPYPARVHELAAPADTILLAELSTRAPMNGPYGTEPAIRPFTWSGDRSSPQWKRAWPGWIDVSPKAFIEDATPRAGCYQEPYATGSTDKGIARDLYDGGGCYAFCDGHVEFLPLKDTVGLGEVVYNTTITPANCWAWANHYNKWNQYKYAR